MLKKQTKYNYDEDRKIVTTVEKTIMFGIPVFIKTLETNYPVDIDNVSGKNSNNKEIGFKK